MTLDQVEGNREEGRALARWLDAIKKAAGGSMYRAVTLLKISCLGDAPYK